MPLSTRRRHFRAHSLELLPLGFTLLVATGMALYLESPISLVLATAALHQPDFNHRLRQHSALRLLAGQFFRMALFGGALLSLPALAAATEWPVPTAVPAERVLLALAIGLALSGLWFFALRALLKQGHFSRRLAVVGVPEAIAGIATRLREHPDDHFDVLGFFDERRPEELRRLVELGQREWLDAIVVARSKTQDGCTPELRQQLRQLSAPVVLAAPTANQAPWLFVDDLDLQTFTQLAASFGEDRYRFVVTPNADHLVRLEADPGFRASYEHADFVLFDSRFLARWMKWTRKLPIRVCPGSDLTAALFREVITCDDRILMIGGDAEQAQQLRSRHGLRDLRQFVPPMGFIQDDHAIRECLEFVEKNSPFRFCLLAVGAPQQERIAALLKERGRARGLALCIGASLNFLTGGERRAPDWMQRAGLEWLYRLLQDPRRLAARYLWRGPRVFAVLARRTIVTRKRLFTVPAATPSARTHRNGSAPRASQRQTG